MCLIIHGGSALIRSTLLNTPFLIEEIYENNKDGLGIMYNGTRGARVYKWLPKNVEEARTAVAMFPQDDRELAVHWRWRTHGDVDKANCHPYPVDGGGYLIHNGVLETGNAADKTRSDTYHYIEKFLKGGVMERVGHEPAFLKLLTDHIGRGNKFVLMTSDGRMSIAGRHRGFDLGGLWWSNSYAWDPLTLDKNWVDPDARTVVYGKGSYAGGLDNWKGYMNTGWTTAEEDEEVAEDVRSESWSELLMSCDTDGIVSLIEEFPYQELCGLFDLGWGMESYSQEVLDTKHQELLDLVLKGDAVALARECRAGYLHHIADVLAYYVAWTTTDPDEEPVQPTTHESPTPANASYAG